MKYLQIIAGILALIGIVTFGLASPESRPKIHELYLAGAWALMAFSTSAAYFDWSLTHWSRKILAVAAPAAALVYLVIYLT